MAKKTAAADPAGPRDPAKKLRKLIKGGRVAMLTTVGPEGGLRSRPMLDGQLEDGVLSFLTSGQSGKAFEIADNQRVHLTYASRKAGRYVSISGVATIVHDAAQARRLWSKEHRDWFPAGKNDPDLAVLKVAIERVEYWDAAEGRMVALIEGRPEGVGGPAPAGGGKTRAVASVTSGALG